MHSINALFKLNDFGNKKLDYSKMNLSELKVQLNKFESLNQNKKLQNTLPDKGEKIKEQLKILKDLIDQRSLHLKADTKTDSVIEKNQETIELPPDVEEIIEKLEGTDLKQQDCNKNEENLEEPKDSVESMLTVNQRKDETSVNYFAKKVQENQTSVNKSKSIYDEEKYRKIKEKLKNKANNQPEMRQAKMIPVDECVKLLREHEKRVQELQMKQAAERLLNSKSVSYNYSFLDKESSEELKYRESNQSGSGHSNELNEDEKSENEETGLDNDLEEID